MVRIRHISWFVFGAQREGNPPLRVVPRRSMSIAVFVQRRGLWLGTSQFRNFSWAASYYVKI